MIKFYISGIRQANASWKMILLLLIANVFFALPFAVPIFLLITQTAGGNLYAQRLYGDNLNAIWFSDLVNEQFADASPATLGLQFVLMLLVIGAFYLVFNTFLAGGVLEVFTSEGRSFTMKKFWAGCGAYFWRFFRLMIISAIFYAIAIGIFALVAWRIDKSDSKATVERPTALKNWAALLGLVLLLSLINMVFDYARIGAVLSDRRAMVRQTLRALRLSLRRFFTTFGLYLLIGLTGLVLFAVLFWLRSVVSQSSLGTIALAAAIGQVAIASRMWTRLACYAAEVDLYRSLEPTPTSTIAEPQPAPENTAAPTAPSADEATGQAPSDS